MKLQTLKLLIGLLIISFFLSAASYSKEQPKNMSELTEKIGEMKNMQKIINDKLNLLEKEKKELKQKKADIDAYVKQKKDTIDRYVAEKQKELDTLTKQIADAKLKKLASIYSNAKPQAAATELSQMDEDLAAQILTLMQPRKAGAIISKMNPQKASKIFQKFMLKQEKPKNFSKQ